MNASRLNELGAWELARMLTHRDVTAQAVVESCIERIELRDPQIHAWAQLGIRRARRYAEVTDDSPVSGLMHGLPIGVKDLLDVAGMPNSCGSVIYANLYPVSDAASVALCREAGAIVMGKTATTELGLYHPGATVNPNRAGHTPGGSSCGSAAAVADGMVPLAIGSQTAGSIIRGAAFCGVFGFKPTLGKVARGGLKLLADSLDTIGGFARSPQDLGLLAAILCGDPSLLDIDEDSAPRIGLAPSPPWDAASFDTRTALDGAGGLLSAAGARVGDFRLPPQYICLGDVQAEIMAYEVARSLTWERIERAQALSYETHAVLNTGMNISPRRHQENLQRTFAAREAFDACFGDFDVLLAPSAVGAAPHGLATTGDPVYCRMWTLLGLPCLHIPFGTSAGGMPVGLQVVGRRGADRRVLQAAHWMAQRLGRMDLSPRPRF